MMITGWKQMIKINVPDTSEFDPASGCRCSETMRWLECPRHGDEAMKSEDYQSQWWPKDPFARQKQQFRDCGKITSKDLQITIGIKDE